MLKAGHPRAEDHPVPVPAPPRRGPRPPVPGYQLAAPTALDALTRLAQAVGGVEALRRWSEVTRSLDLHGLDLELDDLERVADAFVDLGGPLAVVARAWTVRIRSYRTLSATTTPAGGTR